MAIMGWRFPQKRLRELMKLLREVLTAAMTLPSSNKELALQQQQDAYIIRPFDMTDQCDLEIICRHVYNGRDYLPQTSQALVNDDDSQFVVLCNTNQVLAVANARMLRIHNILWLEAIRTSQAHVNQGCATKLTRHFVNLAQQRNQTLYSCTVASNVAMRKVFKRVGLVQVGCIHQLQFSDLIKLEGWSKGDARTAKPLLQAYGQDFTVNELDDAWVPVTDMAELQTVLRNVQNNGGLGFMPGLYELLSQRQVEECLNHKTIWKSSHETAAVALVKDDKIQSLQSPWVCSVAAVDAHDVASALNFLCGSSSHARPFTLSVDGAVLLEESALLSALPFASDACLLFASAAD
ncbi:hypothetical protein MPSEU_000627500 [Mayamaea pseudoterrestris]|nr:hypothetical protein MPSEU_000627500 [Mayamaea pseudoterrestris]